MLKRILFAVLGIVVVLVLLGAGMMFVGKNAVSETVSVAARLDSIEPDSASLARGHHLSLIMGCQACHGDQLEGKVLVDAPPFFVAPSNLTAGEGGVGDAYTVSDWDRAIRSGVNRKGRRLMIMPSAAYRSLSDEDTAALIAYVQAAPPVDHHPGTTELRPMGAILTAAGQMDGLWSYDKIEDHTFASPPVQPGPTAEYGAYIGQLCGYCHGKTLEGGPPAGPDEPAPPSLRAAAEWPLEMFDTAVRTGVAPDGRQMSPDFMPWDAFQHMNDTDIQALHAYLKRL